MLNSHKLSCVNILVFNIHCVKDNILMFNFHSSHYFSVKNDVPALWRIRNSLHNNESL